MSRLTYAGPVSRSYRFTLPHVPAAGAEKTDVSNQSAFAPMPPSTLGVSVTFGVWEFPGARRPEALAVKLIGMPEVAENRPVICQSPSTLPATPSRSHFPSGPSGSIYTKLFV